MDAYTQQKLSVEHIDHYKRKAGHFYPQLCFEYDNLFVANHNSDYGASYKDNHIKKEDYETIYNPALHMDKFQFSFDGSISPLGKEDDKAKRTIEMFNLDDQTLNTRRADIFRNAKNMSQQLKIDHILELLVFEFHSGVNFLLYQAS